MGEAAAGAAWAEAGTAVAEGAVRQAAVGGAGQRDALGQRLAACAAGLRKVEGAALSKDVGGGNGAAAGDGAAAVAEGAAAAVAEGAAAANGNELAGAGDGAAVQNHGAAAIGGGGVPPAAVGRQNRAFGQGQGAVYCAKQNNAASSKKSSARGRTRAEKLEHKIKTKLRHHRDSCSSVKYESDNEKLARKLKDLFNEKDEARKAQYVEWLNSCFAYIMPKDADYKGLYDFLMK